MLLFASTALAILLQTPQSSQPPSQGPPQSSKDEKRQGTTEQRVGRKDNTKADNASSAVEKPRSEITSRKDQQTSDEDKSDPSSGWFKGSTIATAIATLAIAVLGFLQWRAMHKQRLAMEEQAKYMGQALSETVKAANAATENAESSKRQVSVMEAQSASTKQAADAATVGALAAQQSAQVIINSERAWLLLEKGPTGNVTPGGIAFQFKNHGRTPAWITEINTALVLSKRILLDIDPSVLEVRPFNNFVVVPGETTRPWVNNLKPLDAPPDEFNATWVFFFGIVKYRDIFQQARETGFLFQFVENPGDDGGVWLPSGRPESNYNT